MKPVALVCSEPMRPRMAGIGIRYLEMARRLPALGVPVVLISPFRSDDERRAVAELVGPSETRTYRSGSLAEALKGCRAVVAQGQLANEVIHQGYTLPLVIDFYDPWLIENLHYHESLGLDPYRNDHATWMLQAAAGDLFLCSSHEQKLFYAGLLAASGRINPISVRDDAALDRLVRIVPFGVPEQVNEHDPVLPERKNGERRILFGGLYDWYDPWPLLDAFAELVAGGRPAWRLYIVDNPNAGTPQKLIGEVRAWVARRRLTEQVQFLDWQPAERRYDLLRDVDVLAATHRSSLETFLSLRTRFLDALAVSCPILVTEGGTMSRLVGARGAGWVVPEGDTGAIREALIEIMENTGERARRTQAASDLAREFKWERVLAPLADYLRDPWRDETKAEFAARLPTAAPPDRFGFRLRRKFRRTFGKGLPAPRGDQ